MKDPTHCGGNLTPRRFNMKSWNKRNGQRATVKRPGTKSYNADYKNRRKQFFQKKTEGCKNCGSTSIKAKGGNGRLFIYCANCGKQLKVLNTKPTKVGDWSNTVKYRSRAGLCRKCGGGSFTGRMRIRPDGKKFELDLTCQHCGAGSGWHDA